MSDVNGANVDNKRLKSLYSSGKAGKFAFDYFAGRQNNSKQTSVDRLQTALKAEGHDVSRGDIIELFKSLEAASCGSFVVGRKGHQSRFEWAVSLVEVGQVATGEEVQVQDLEDSDIQLEPEQDSLSGGLIEHRFVLRPSFEARIQLPPDLSMTEANRLSDFLRTLPFSR